MKRIGWWILILALSLPLLGGCDWVEPAGRISFADLARRLPGDMEQSFFLDLKPAGDAGRYWQRIQQKIVATPSGQEALDGLLSQFDVEPYGLEEQIVGPMATCYHNSTSYLVAQVADEAAARETLLGLEDVQWQQEDYESRTLYSGRYRQNGALQYLIWTLDDGLLFLADSYAGASPSYFKELLSVGKDDSLAALSSWQTLMERLPAEPMGLLFLNVAQQFRTHPPARDDTSRSTLLGRQTEAVALAAVPEADGMRVEIAAAFLPGTADLPELRVLFDLPAVDPPAWTGLPADTAFALIGHDTSLLWPWLNEIFGLNTTGLGLVREVLGLDLEADLLSSAGPLAGDWAMALTPPLPGQPISQGLAAGQLLFLARGATPAQADGVRTAMESRGAVFGPRQVEGVALQVQAGTEPSGYAITYGFDGDTLLFGSSPEVVGRGVTAQRDGGGLVETQAFRAILDKLLTEPMLVAYLHSPSVFSLIQTNTSDQQYQSLPEYAPLEAFEAIGVSLRLRPDRLDGVAYFFLADSKSARLVR